MFEARDFFLRMFASNTCSFTSIPVKRYFIYEAAPLRSANSDAASDASADPLSQVVAAAGLAAAAAVASVMTAVDPQLVEVPALRRPRHPGKVAASQATVQLL